MDPIKAYLDAKAAASRANDWAAGLRGAARTLDLPRFAKPEDAAVYWHTHGAPYTGDPLWGALDFYVHPTRYQAILEGRPGSAAPVDCDDLAVWSFACLRQTEGLTPRVVTLVDAGITKSHVICVGKGHGPQYWAIDTNGFRFLHNWSAPTLLEEWGLIYPDTAYVAAVDTPYPFEEEPYGQ